MKTSRLIVAVLALLVSATGASAQPTVEIVGQTVVAFGLVPGSSAVLFGVTREERSWVDQVVSQVMVAAADGRGEASFTPAGGLPARSVWAVVDVTSGEVAAAAPAGTELRWMGSVDSYSSDVPQRFADRLESRRTALEALLTRPGLGAWYARLVDGGTSDADGAADGQLAATPQLFVALSTGQLADPGSFDASDQIVAIDPHTLELFVALPGAAAGGER